MVQKGRGDLPHEVEERFLKTSEEKEKAQKIQKIIDELREELGCHLANLAIVDEIIREVLERNFAIKDDIKEGCYNYDPYDVSVEISSL